MIGQGERNWHLAGAALWTRSHLRKNWISSTGNTKFGLSALGCSSPPLWCKIKVNTKCKNKMVSKQKKNCYSCLKNTLKFINCS